MKHSLVLGMVGMKGSRPNVAGMEPFHRAERTDAGTDVGSGRNCWCNDRGSNSDSPLMEMLI